MRLSILLLLTHLTVYAGSPEVIAPRTLELRNTSWYAEQSEAWASMVQNSPHDPHAWFNYYASSRFAQHPAPALNAIVADMAKAVGGSYEQLLVDGWNMGWTRDAYDQVRKAYRNAPERPNTYGLLALFSELNLDASQRKEFSSRLYQGGQISPSLLNYSYNVLMSVEEGSVLFTEGENTTLPLFVLQDVMNVRRDVVVLNLDLLMQPEYLASKFASIGLSPVDHAEKKEICREVPIRNATRHFYYALTLQQVNIEEIKDQLYVVGLASQLSPARMDNISVIRQNLEKRFLMDYLRVDFNAEGEHAAGKVLSANYLIPMLLLYDDYRSANNVTGMNELEQLLRKVAQQSGKESIVSAFLIKDVPGAVPYFPNGVDFKAMGLFKPITKKLLANETEVTNAQYNLFLAYLKKNGLNDLYDLYKFNLSSYQEPALAMMKTYSAAERLNKAEKLYENYPAVNISYEGAVAYCDWLTDQYNNSASRKYRKVKFRLPTSEEWIVAAAGVKNPTSFDPSQITLQGKFYPDMSYDAFGKKFEMKTMKLSDPDVMYPWYFIYNFRNSPRNKQDCFLGNFKMLETTQTCRTLVGKISTPDGFQAMSATKNYFPNEAGLYDVVGNVEEMLAERGRSAGGSWNHLPEESTIKSIHSYDVPNAYVGFRVFMEIIEE